MHMFSHPLIEFWPETTVYFKYGIYGHLKKFSNLNETITKPCVFVDFSVTNIRTLVKLDWINFMSEKIVILVPDRRLRPLANYIYHHYRKKNYIQYVMSNYMPLTTKIELNKVFFGFNVSPFPGAIKISDMEYFILKMIICNQATPKEISNIADEKIKNIYSHIRSLETKLGLRIRTLLL